MKKTVWIALLALFCMSAQAQDKKWFFSTAGIGASLDLDVTNPFMTGYRQLKDDEGKIQAFGLNPEFGYHFTDNFAAGIGLGYTHFKTTFEDSSFESKVNVFGINPYVFYYFYRNGGLSFFVKAEGHYAKYKVKGGGDADSWGVGVLPVASYRISDSFAINASFARLGYTDFEGEKDFGLNLDMGNLNFSLIYLF